MVKLNNPQFKILILILFILPFIGMVSGVEPDFKTPILQNYSFVASVSVNGNPINPSEDGTCNFTIRNPYNSFIYEGANMSISPTGDASIFINGSVLNEIGFYPGKLACNQGSLNETRVFTLEVTPSRNPTGYGFFLILAISGSLILILGIYQQNFYLGFLSGMIIMLAGMFGLVYGVGPFANLYSRALSISVLGIGLVINIAASFEAIEEMKIKFSWKIKNKYQQFFQSMLSDLYGYKYEEGKIILEISN